MAKKSKKRLGRHEKDQAGCMWSLLNIFDFRHVRSSQKLLLDKKRGSRHLDGAAFANIQLELLSDSCKICNESKEALENETSSIDPNKMSVKELMEEEMCGEQDGEKQGSIPGEHVKPTVGDDKGPTKKSRRWSRSKMSFDLGTDGFVVAGDLVERPVHRKHKSCSSVDLNEVVEELCSQIGQKDSELSIEKIGDSFVVEKRLASAAKVLVKHFTEGKSGAKEGEIQPSKELTEALQILNSNKELFLKLLQDPNSQLVKHLQSLQDIHLEEGKFKVLTGSTDLLEQDIGTTKQPNFFWRSFRGQERNSWRKSDTSLDFSRIVVLKPGPPSSENSDAASTCSSLPESPKSTKDKDDFQKTSFPFTFTEFMRKLKHAMRKDRAASRQHSDMQPNMANRDKKVGGEPVGIASPSRDHFFIERIPKKLKDSKIQVDHESGLTPEQRVSNIYVEAKRHLADIVGNGEVDLNTHGRKVPKSLGRILSYSGYSSPTICSPRPVADGKTSSNMQEIDLNCPYQLKQEPENEPHISSDKLIGEEEMPAIESLLSDGLPCKSDVDKHTRESSEDIMREYDAVSQSESNLLDNTVESGFMQDVIKTEQADSSEKQNTGEENEHSSCLDSSTVNCSLSGKMEDLDAMSDATSRPSPISVLEPIFKEDDISPPGIKHITEIEPIRPRQIMFEEEIILPIRRAPSGICCFDDDKYTFEFVKDVAQMSGLTWDELLRRSLFCDYIIDPSLIDEVDFLPDLLSCDFNLLFDLVNEVVIELCLLNCGLLAHPNLNGKPIFSEVWKGVNWYLTFEAAPRTLDQIIGKDLAKPSEWGSLRIDCENIGIQIQEAILEELVEDMISTYVSGSVDSEIVILLPAEEEMTD